MVQECGVSRRRENNACHGGIVEIAKPWQQFMDNFKEVFVLQCTCVLNSVFNG